MWRGTNVILYGSTKATAFLKQWFLSVFSDLMLHISNNYNPLYFNKRFNCPIFQ